MFCFRVYFLSDICAGMIHLSNPSLLQYSYRSFPLSCRKPPEVNILRALLVEVTRFGRRQKEMGSESEVPLSGTRG